MKLTIVGCGDAFGSGGRLQSCYHVAASGGEFLIDCGATALIGFARLGLDPDRVTSIFISHLHGDHFSGLVWWVLHAHYVTRRTAPLTVIGPAGICERFSAAAEVLFPGSTAIERRFSLQFREYSGEVPHDIGGVQVTPFEVQHPSGATPYALRFACDGKVFGFSGDTRWVESLVDAARDTDLFLIESYNLDPQTGYHMSWREIENNLDRLTTRRLVLTHMGGPMLAHRDGVRHPRVLLAEDGLCLDI